MSENERKLLEHNTFLKNDIVDLERDNKQLQAENERLKGVIHDVIILTEESSTKEFAEQALKGE